MAQLEQLSRRDFLKTVLVAGATWALPDVEKTRHPLLPESQMLTWENNRWPGVASEIQYVQHLIRKYVDDVQWESHLPWNECGKTVKDGMFYSSVIAHMQTDHIFPELAKNQEVIQALSYLDQHFKRYYGNSKGALQWEPVQCVGMATVISAMYGNHVARIGAAGTEMDAVDFIPPSVRERTAFPFRPVDYNGYQVIPLSDTVNEFDSWHFFQPGDFMVYFDPKNLALATGHMLFVQGVTRNPQTHERELVFVSDANFVRQSDERILCNGLPRTFYATKVQCIAEFGGKFSNVSVLRSYH